jgi:integrase
MAIYKRAGIYWMDIRLAGKRKRLSTGATNKQKAREIEAKTIEDVRTGRWFEKEKEKEITIYTFKDLADQYEKWMVGRYRSDFKTHFIKQLRERFRGMTLQQITQLELETLQSERLLSGHRKMKVDGKLQSVPNAPATINRLIATIAHMLTKAGEWGMIAKRDIPKVKQLLEMNERLRYLDLPECHLLISCCEPHLKPIVITALNSGMRKGEILSLRWNMTDLKNGFILLNRTKSGKRREIPVNATLRATLQALPRRLDVPYVFFDPSTGKPYRECKRSFATACRRAGLIDLRFHDLRHTFASQLIMSGIDITTVKELLGHASLKMTLRYAHLAPTHKVNAVGVLDTLMSQKWTNGAQEGNFEAKNRAIPV